MAGAAAKIAVALAGASNQECLRKIERVASYASTAEVRLDLMETFDVVELVEQSPIPLVMTFRPAREGGKYVGDESTRLDVLHTAVDAGVAYVDVEVDALDAIARWRATDTLVMASHHDFESVPNDLLQSYENIRERCDIVKLVGTANTVADSLAVFELLRSADTPVVTMAMGEAGRMTRVLAPYFSSCLFTYGAASEQDATAPGQLSVQAMVDGLGLDKLNPSTSLQFRIGQEWGAAWVDDAVTFEVPASDGIARTLTTAFPEATFCN